MGGWLAERADSWLDFPDGCAAGKNFHSVQLGRQPLYGRRARRAFIAREVALLYALCEFTRQISYLTIEPTRQPWGILLIISTPVRETITTWALGLTRWDGEPSMAWIALPIRLRRGCSLGILAGITNTP